MTFYTYPNRLLCEVLEEMRKHLKCLSAFNRVRYKASMSMLIEEAQTLANRMESALEDWDDIRRAHKEVKKLKKEIAELEKKEDK